jgi:hypothetical protein
MELSITVSGRELVQRAPRTAQSRLQEAMRRMPPEQVHELARALEVLVHEGGFADTTPPMFFEDEGAPGA